VNLEPFPTILNHSDDLATSRSARRPARRDAGTSDKPGNVAGGRRGPSLRDRVFRGLGFVARLDRSPTTLVGDLLPQARMGAVRTGSIWSEKALAPAWFQD